MYVLVILTFFCLFILRMIQMVNPERARWVHLAHSGNQSDHKFPFILPIRAASDMIN